MPTIAGHKVALSYKDFIEEKTQLGTNSGFAPKFMPSFLFDFQSDLVTSALVDDGHSALIWGHLNDECDLLEEIIKGSVQVSGADSDEEKEEKFTAFASGKIKDLITKPKIGAWGLNFQNCAHVVSFASQSLGIIYLTPLERND
jgi:hypothetical protein